MKYIAELDLLGFKTYVPLREPPNYTRLYKVPIYSISSTNYSIDKMNLDQTYKVIEFEYTGHMDKFGDDTMIVSYKLNRRQFEKIYKGL